MPPKRRNTSSSVSRPSKRSRSGGIKSEQRPDVARSSNEDEMLKERFISMFSNNQTGISNSAMKAEFGSQYGALVPIINELTQSSRLSMSKVGDELFYSLISEDIASKFTGLDVSARMVYQVIEKSGNMGVWTKEVRNQTNIQQQALNKIFKALESRKLIKPVKSVSAKKVYMLYNLTPAKELTGGAWYTELEFDHEFIHEMRKFLMTCVKRLHGGNGVTLAEISQKMTQAKISKVSLTVEEVQQLMQTLVYDNLIESYQEDKQTGEALFVATRRVTSMCDFQWWGAAIDPDFHFRTIRFEDGVQLAAHEPHHHTA